MKADRKIRIYNKAVAVVTGGASGIGRALGEELARRGCEVLLADRQIKEANEVAVRIQKNGGKAETVCTDVTDFSAMEHLIRYAVESRGRLDYLFNNAGIAMGGAAEQLQIEDWYKTVDVNLRGVINGVHATYPVMIRQGFGHIVNTGSMAGLMPNPLNIPYAATKHAVVGLSMSLRAEAAHLGIRVSVLCPGVIRTPILEGGRFGSIKMNMPPEKLREIWETLKPMPPDDFAKAALNAVAGNKAIIILPARWKVAWWLNRLSPSLGTAFVTRRYANIRKKMGL